MVVGLSALSIVVHEVGDASAIHSISWPVIGLWVALLVSTRRALWLGVVPAGVALSFLSYLYLDYALGESLLIPVSHAIGAVAAATIIRRGRDVPATLDDLPDLGRLLMGVMAVGAACTAEAWAGSYGHRTDLEGLLLIASAHGASAMLFVPVAITWRDRSPEGAGRDSTPGERILQILLLIAVTATVFAPSQERPLAFLPLPILMWAAVRFDLRSFTRQLAAFGAAVSVTSLLGWGPFGGLPIADGTGTFGALATYAYLVCLAMTLLCLAVLLHQGHLLTGALRNNEFRFRRTFTESPSGMLLLSDSGRNLVVEGANPAAEQILDRQADGVVGVDLSELIEAAQPFDPLIHALRDGRRESWHGHCAVRSRPQSRLQVSLVALGANPHDDAPAMFSAQLIDVTDEHDARRRQETAQRLTDATLDTAGCMIMVIDQTGRILRLNAAAKDMTGYADSELLGRRVWDTPVAPMSRTETEALFVWPNRSGLPLLREQTIATRAGGLLRLEWSNNVVLGSRGIPEYAVMTGVDVTRERTTSGLINHLLQVSTGTALIGLDTSGRITLFNTGAEHLLGFDRHEVEGSPFVGLLEPAELYERTGVDTPGAAFTALVGGLAASDAKLAPEWTWLDKSGRRLAVSMTLSQTQDEVQGTVGFLCVARDVTEARESRRALASALDKERAALQSLRAIDQAKDEVVSTVSHELRTPLASIMGYAELLLEGNAGEITRDQRRLVETIVRNGERLLAISNDLLVMAGFGASPGDPGHVPVDLRDTVRGVQETIRPLLDGRELSTSMQAPDCPVIVSGDAAQLDRVLLNLVSNAIKFTEDGGAVLVHLAVEGPDAIITVQDSGIGIAEEELSQVFDKFFRTAAAQHRAIPGTGLGLSIVEAIVTAHGGHISVRSTSGVGTEFTVRLPLLRDALAVESRPTG